MSNDADAIFVANAEAENKRAARRAAIAELDEINECECSARTWEHITNALLLLRGV